MEYVEKLIFLLKVSSLNIVVSQAGNPILFALGQSGSFPLLRFEWQVEQIQFELSTLVLVVVIHALSIVLEPLGYLFASHFLTDDQYHN